MQRLLAVPRAFDPRRLPLRWQLSLAMVLVLSLTLLAAVAVVLGNARKAVADELQASLAATTSSLDATLLLLARTPAEQSTLALRDWIKAQSGNRHLCAALSSGPVASAAVARCPDRGLDAGSAPAWFSRGVTEQPQAVRRDFSIDGLAYTLQLIADPRQELDESWQETRELLQLIVLMAFSANALIVLLVTRALAPLGAATRALSRMHVGDFEPRMPRSQASDLSALLAGIDSLAQQLAVGTDENRRLLLKNLDLQEEERRLMARELHDEIGQHVAAIEMASIVLDSTAAGGDAASRGSLLRIRESVSEIHQLSRRMIRRLRPAALDTLGLAGGLQTLLMQWKSGQPQLAVVDEIDPQCDRVDAYTATHVYRIVQEALSNAVRHARADQVQVQLLMVRNELRLRIADDGHGFDPDVRTPGLGLMGIRERVKALGGELEIVTGRYAGCRLQIRLPLPAQTAPRRRESAAARELATLAIAQTD